MIIKSKAKINLFLHIIGKESNFHELESLFCFANELYDEINIVETKNTTKEIIVNPLNLKIKDNLILRIAEEFEKYLGRKIGFKCYLKKNIPISAGLAGGSGNAAAALKLMQKIWDFSLNDEEIRKICYKIGSDVYLCYKERSCFLNNKKIQNIEIPRNAYLLIFNNGISVSTKEVFQNWSGDFTKTLKNPVNTHFLDFLKSQHNDLEKVAKNFFDLDSILENIQNQAGCHFSRMSGSGSSCFGVFDDFQNAQKAQANLFATYPNSKTWISSIC